MKKNTSILVMHNVKVLSKLRDLIAQEKRNSAYVGDEMLALTIMNQGLFVTKSQVRVLRKSNDIPEMKERRIINYSAEWNTKTNDAQE